MLYSVYKSKISNLEENNNLTRENIKLVRGEILAYFGNNIRDISTGTCGRQNIKEEIRFFNNTKRGKKKSKPVLLQIR